MKTQVTKSEVIAAQAIVGTKSKPVKFKDFMGNLDKGTEAYKARRKVYNDAQDIVNAAAMEAAEETKFSIRSSILKPDKHRITSVSGVKTGSVIFQISEDERAAKQEAFLVARRDKLTQSESGLSESEFIALAKQGGWVNMNYRDTSPSTGNQVFTTASCKRWLADRDDAIVKERIAKSLADKQSKEKDKLKPAKDKAA